MYYSRSKFGERWTGPIGPIPPPHAFPVLFPVICGPVAQRVSYAGWINRLHLPRSLRNREGEVSLRRQRCEPWADASAVRAEYEPAARLRRGREASHDVDSLYSVEI